MFLNSSPISFSRFRTELCTFDGLICMCFQTPLFITDAVTAYLSLAINKVTNKNLTLRQRYRRRQRALAIWLVRWINGHYIRDMAKQICWLLLWRRGTFRFYCYRVCVCVCVLCANVGQCRRCSVGVACSRSFYCAAVVVAFAFIAVCSLINLWFVVAARSFYVWKIRNYCGSLPCRCRCLKHCKLVNRFIVGCATQPYWNSMTF